MKLLNRSALLVKARQPMADWVAQVAEDEALSLSELRAEGALYLVDEQESPDDKDTAIAANWDSIFRNELGCWDEFGDNWPQVSAELFAQWFDCELIPVAFDLSADDLLLAKVDE